MGKALLALIGIVLFVYALFDLIATPGDRVRLLPKFLWFVLLLFVPVGPILWLVFGHLRDAGPSPRSGQTRPRPPRGPLGPDDDPDYLRGL
jgi:hypothetical protein